VNTVRTLGIFMALAALSFVLGFFVLSRMVPGGGKPAVASTLPLDAPNAPETVVSRERSDTVAVQSDKGAEDKGLSQPRAHVGPGPSLDPEDGAPSGPNSTGVQHPRKIDDSGAPAHSAFGDGPEGHAASGRDNVADSTAVAAPSSSRRRRIVARKTDVGAAAPTADEATGSSSTIAPSSDETDTNSRRTRRPRSSDADAQDAVDESATVQSDTNRGSEADSPTGSMYHVHLGSFHSRDAAGLEVERARTKGFETQIVPITRSGRTLYRVQIGAFRDRKRAESVKQSLQDASLDAIVSEQRR